MTSATLGEPGRQPARRGTVGVRSSRLTLTETVARALAAARRYAWTDAFTTRVIIASIPANRRRLGVFGPCVYCGDWTASSVDHVIPRSRGGRDAADNAVSACVACNAAKGNRLLAEWAAPAIPTPEGAVTVGEGAALRSMSVAELLGEVDRGAIEPVWVGPRLFVRASAPPGRR